MTLVIVTTKNNVNDNRQNKQQTPTSVTTNCLGHQQKIKTNNEQQKQPTTTKKKFKNTLKKPMKRYKQKQEVKQNATMLQNLWGRGLCTYSASDGHGDDEAKKEQQ